MRVVIFCPAIFLSKREPSRIHPKMSEFLDRLRQSSAYFGANAPFIEDLFEAYLKDPSSVPDEWRAHFDTLPPIHSERPLFFLPHGHGHAAARPEDLEEDASDDPERREDPLA